MKVLVAALAAGAALATAGCGATGHQAIDQASSAQSAGKKAFTASCGGCHTLKDAGTTGTTGPNLDDAWTCADHQGFKRSTFRDVVRGQIDYANPPMPRELVKGETADDVADYVASVAGKNVPCTT